jgi:WD40 repeat protein
MTTVSARPNPYVGTRPYKKGEILYGRERETSELLDLLIAERLVLLYSPSGAGKSSLLNASILPKMEENGFEVLPIMRVNYEPPPSAELDPGFNRYIYSLLMCAEEAVEAEKRFSPNELSTLRLKDYLARYRQRAQQLDPAYDATRARLLVIDQGEEIITIAPTERDQKQAFFNQLGETLRDRSLWILFSMREDFLARIDSYIKPIPTGFATRYRLRLLQPEPALSAIQKPAEAQGVHFTDEAAQKLVNDLRMMQVQQPDGTNLTEPGLYVEPVQLQVVCRRIWSVLDRSDNEIGAENLEKIGDVNAALADYYSLQVATVAAKVGIRERFIRLWFDRKLITSQGIRGQVLLAPNRSDGLENEAIWELEKTYLVRSEKRGGSTWFEISHDRLITPIIQNNAAWFEKNLSALQRQADVWNQEGRPDGMLVTGPDFLVMQQWVEQHQAEMSEMENEFYQGCLKAHLSDLREQRNNFIIRWLGAAAALTAIIAIFFFFRARIAEQRAVARELAAASVSSLTVDPELSLLLALASQKVTGDLTRENIEALHRALPEMRVEKSLTGHKNKIYAVVFSPDGKTIVSGGQDGLVKIWDLATGREVKNLVVVPDPGDKFGVTNVVYSPDGRVLAASTQDGNVVLYDTASWQAIKTLPAHQAVIWGLAFSPDGRLLATGSEDHTVKLWEMASGSLAATFGVENCQDKACGDGHTDEVYTVAFSPDGSLLASAGADSAVRVWDVAASRFLFKLAGPNAHTGLIWAVAFSPDGTRLASASSDRAIKIWSVTTQDWVMNIDGHTDWVYALAYTRDGKNLISASADRTIRIWDTLYGRLETTLTGHTDEVFALNLSKDNRYLVSAGQDLTVRLWNISDFGSREILTMDNKDRVNAVAYSPDGSLLASTGRSPDVKIWDARTGTLLNDLTGHRRVVEGLVWGPDGKWLISVSRDGKAIVWDAGTGAQKLVFDKHQKEILDVALAKDASFAATGDGNGVIDLWNPQTGQVLKTLQGQYGSVLSVAISPNQKWVAAGYELEKIVIWDVATGQPLYTLSGHTDFVEEVRFNAAGTLLGSVSDDGFLLLWDLSAAPPVILSKTPAQRGTIYAVAFTGDDKQVITGGADGLINVREISDPKEPHLVYTLYGFTDRVQSLDVNARNAQIAAGSSDNTVRVFTLDTQELVAQAQSRLTRSLSEEECQNYLSLSCANFAKGNWSDDLTILLARLFAPKP